MLQSASKKLPYCPINPATARITKGQNTETINYKWKELSRDILQIIKFIKVWL